MADTSLTFNILAENNASSTLQRVANGVDRIDNNVSQVNRTLGGMTGALQRVTSRGRLMGGAVAGAIGTLPATATAASAGIVTALGGGLAAVGLTAAAQSKKVRQEFTATKNHITMILQQIATPFESTLTGIAAQARRTFTDLAPALQDAFKTMAPAIETVGTQLLKAFASPQVKTAIREIASAFTELVKAVGPRLPGMVKDIAGQLTRLAKTVAANKGTFVFLAQALGGIARAGLAVLGFFAGLPPSVVLALAAAFGVLATAVLIATLPITGFALAIAVVVGAIVGLTVLIIRNWDRIRAFTVIAWNIIKRVAVGAAQAVWGAIVGAWNAITSATSAAWDWIRRKAVGAMTGIVGFFTRLPGRIGRALGGLASMLYNTGRDIVTGMLNGLLSMTSWLAGQLWSWVKDVIPGPIEKALGISSPSKLMAEVGKNVGQGLAEGMQASTRDVQNASQQMARAAMVDPAARDAAAGVTAAGRGGARRGGATAARGRGEQTVRIEVAGPEEMKKLLRSIVRKDGQGNVQTAFGQS